LPCVPRVSAYPGVGAPTGPVGGFALLSAPAPGSRSRPAAGAAGSGAPDVQRQPRPPPGLRDDSELAAAGDDALCQQREADVAGGALLCEVGGGDAAAVVLDPQPGALAVGLEPHLDGGGGGVAFDVAERLAGGPVEQLVGGRVALAVDARLQGHGQA